MQEDFREKQVHAVLKITKLTETFEETHSSLSRSSPSLQKRERWMLIPILSNLRVKVSYYILYYIYILYIVMFSIIHYFRYRLKVYINLIKST